MTVIAPWRGLAAAATSPVWRQPDLALDGYLTGVIIAPRPIPTAYWQGAVLASDDLLQRDESHARVTRDTLVSRHAALIGDIDEHLARLERDRVCDTGRRFGRVRGRRRTPRSGAGRAVFQWR